MVVWVVLDLIFAGIAGVFIALSLRALIRRRKPGRPAAPQPVADGRARSRRARKSSGFPPTFG
jgi:hypothetical protein